MHQTDIKELAAKKADCCNASRLLYLSHKAALQRTEENTAGDQQACTFSNCVKGNTTLQIYKLISPLSSFF